MKIPQPRDLILQRLSPLTFVGIFLLVRSRCLFSLFNDQECFLIRSLCFCFVRVVCHARQLTLLYYDLFYHDTAVLLEVYLQQTDQYSSLSLREFTSCNQHSERNYLITFTDCHNIIHLLENPQAFQFHCDNLKYQQFFHYI